MQERGEATIKFWEVIKKQFEAERKIAETQSVTKQKHKIVILKFVSLKFELLEELIIASNSNNVSV
jgi:hypothetical protein